MSSSSTAVLTRLASNTGWLLLERAVVIAVTAGVGFYFARYLGPANYGVYNYALSLFGIFATVSKLGINPLVISRTIESPDRQSAIFGSAFTLRMVSGLVCIVLLNATAYVLMQDPLARQLTMILSVALLFAPFETITHWFEAHVRMKPIAVARSVIAILAGSGKLLFTFLGLALLPFAWLVPMEAVLTAVLLLIIYHRQGVRVRDWKADLALMKKISWEGVPLFFSTLAVMTYMRIDQVMLGKMSTAEEVGLYSAAVKISEMFYFLPVLLSGLLFPYLIKCDKRGPRLFQQVFQLMCDGFAWMALTIAVLITVFSAPLITLLYGDAYSASARILVVHTWAGLFIFLEALRSKWFVIRQMTRHQMMTTASGAVLNVLLNLYLIPRYQAYGAAIATTVSYGIAVVLSCFLHRETRTLGGILFRALLAPLRIVQSLRSLAEVRRTVDSLSRDEKR